jgi:hypothetical protein
MKWVHKLRPREEIITKFLLFPKTLRNPVTKKLETRWLTKASWKRINTKLDYCNYAEDKEWAD